IGAYRGGWSKLAAEVIPSASFIMFEANADHESALAVTGRRYFITALGAQNAAANAFHLPKSGDASGASLYVEQTSHYASSNLMTRMLPTSRLDTLVEQNRLERPDMIKIDVQGAELEVLAGAPHTLDHCQALIAELSFLAYNEGAPLFAEVLRKIVDHGFAPVDICELHRGRNGLVMQADLLLVRPSWLARYGAAAGMIQAP
ncbi:MAG: FkbM family methyltransferase, partial [Bradyrhizobium sp.]